MIDFVEQVDEYGKELLMIFSALFYGPQHPRYAAIKQTEVYQRAEVLHERFHAELPAHEDPCFGSDCGLIAVLLFQEIHGRDPVLGEVLRYEEVVECLSPERVAERIRQVQEAWRRHLPGFTCPVRYQDGKEWRLLAEGRRGEQWELHDQNDPEGYWRMVVEAASDGQQKFAEIRAVVFSEAEKPHGHFAVKPAE